MKIIADLHTHSLVSHHAYSTVYENIEAAKKRKLKAICVTDHAKAVKDGAKDSHFKNLGVLPKKYKGIRIYKGAEVNIVDYNGHVDLPFKILASLDFVISSFHDIVIEGSLAKNQTSAYLNVIRNPFIDCIGHSGNPEFPYDHDEIAKACAKWNKIIEINEGSFYSRPGSFDNCTNILRACNKYGTYVCLNSDSHFCNSIGKFKKSKEMIKTTGFDKNLILNLNFNFLDNYIKRRKEEKSLFYEKIVKSRFTDE